MLGQRIRRAREALGLSLRSLGDQIALSHAAIKKYEDGVVTPSSDILIKLSKALGVKVEYFFRPERFTLESICYRKHESIPQSHLDKITAQVVDQVERRVELESLFPSPPFEVASFEHLFKPIKHMEDIEVLAEHVRSQWKLGLGPLPDLIDLFEEKGIKVFELNSHQFKKVDGLYALVNKIPVILMSDEGPGDRQRFTLAHELGHSLLDGRLPEDLDIEICCNRFAGAFLLPKQSLIAILGSHRNAIELRELSLLKEEFGVSMTCILHRAEDSGIINNGLYSSMRSEFKKSGWDKVEPGEQYKKEKTHIFEQMIFHALAEQYIGESKAAELMNMPVESFRALRAMESHDEVARRAPRAMHDSLLKEDDL